MVFLIILTSVLSFSTMDQNAIDKTYLIEQVNKVRSKPCKCGSEWMPAVGQVQWNDTLEYTAYKHARQMEVHGFFSHRSLDGKNVGERLDQAGYKWHYAGENLAEGQRDFDEVIEDWIESPTHCKMLMNPKMKEMGISRYGKYWVQHFGTKMPAGKVRKKVSYREG